MSSGGGDCRVFPSRVRCRYLLICLSFLILIFNHCQILNFLFPELTNGDEVEAEAGADAIVGQEEESDGTSSADCDCGVAEGGIKQPSSARYSSVDDGESVSVLLRAQARSIEELMENEASSATPHTYEGHEHQGKRNAPADEGAEIGSIAGPGPETKKRRKRIKPKSPFSTATAVLSPEDDVVELRVEDITR